MSAAVLRVVWLAALDASDAAYAAWEADPLNRVLLDDVIRASAAVKAAFAAYRAAC